MKPKVVCQYTDKERGDIKGYGIGIITSAKIDKKNFISKIIESIKYVEDENITLISIDRIDFLDQEDILKIQRECNIKVSDGFYINLQLIPYVLKKICEYNSREMKEQEVLIIGGSKDTTKELVLKMAKEIKYLTISYDDRAFLEELSEIILNETGLSMFTTNTVKRLDNYDVIINLNKQIDFSKYNIKKKTIIFDLVKGTKKTEKGKKYNRDLMIITDFIFERSNNIICNNKNFQLNKELQSHTYEILGELKEKDFIKVEINDRFYTIQEASNIYLKLKRRLSKFINKCL